MTVVTVQYVCRDVWRHCNCKLYLLRCFARRTENLNHCVRVGLWTLSLAQIAEWSVRLISPMYHEGEPLFFWPLARFISTFCAFRPLLTFFNAAAAAASAVIGDSIVYLRPSRRRWEGASWCQMAFTGVTGVAAVGDNFVVPDGVFPPGFDMILL